MSYKAYNDYELLYLATEYKDTVALDIMVRKYSNFIYKKIHSFFPEEEDIGDFYQEGLLSLYRAINSFDENYNKTFMRYFEIVLNNRFINIYHRKKRDKERIITLINEQKVRQNFLLIEEQPYISYDYEFKSPTEQFVYEYYFIKNESIEYVAEQLQKTKKQIYNAVYRVKKKIENELKK